MFRFLVLAFIAVASAEVIYDGPCPEVKPIEKFDFPAYQGTWYEIARFPHATEEGTKGKCSTAEYFVDGDKTKVKNSHVIDGVKSYIEGDLTLVEPGKLMLTYTFGGVSKNSYMTVVDSDYKNYSIVYSCKFFKDTNKHQVFAWILSRKTTLEGAAKESVENYLKDSKIIEKSKFVDNDYSEEACKATVTKAITEFLKP
ncbi:unnamed protein product [Parnassius apollo]|uniref:(apollo) hypothetical protein n=1 Tax=Parnassius apollo TaxID=110799 RepID=A0A8S3X650_PARAO|nr:unnamed protein product [Parnassius apollo]